MTAAVAAPAPPAAAQASPSPEPRKLWRQFPLNTERSKAPPPAEPQPTPTAPPATSSSMPGGGGESGSSMRTVQIAAVVLTMALILMLTTGAIAYAARGHYQLGRRRRLGPSFAEAVAVPAPAETDAPEELEGVAGRRAWLPSWSRRRKQRAESPLAGIVSEVEMLRAKLDPRADLEKIERAAEETEHEEMEILKGKLQAEPAPAKSESIANDELERLKDKLRTPAQPESAQRDEREVLKDKLERRPAFEKRASTSRQELETLKAKLANHVGYDDAERAARDDAPLKAKFADVAYAEKRETTLRDNGARAESERKIAFDITDPSPNLDVSRASTETAPAASTDVDVDETALPEPTEGQQVDSVPVQPWRAPPTPRRLTPAELVEEHSTVLAVVAIGAIALALVLLNLAVFFDISVLP